jgi:plastocyanin
MTMTTRTSLFVVLALVACSDKADGGDKKAEPRAKKASTTVAGSTGTIEGKIAFDGAAPAMPELPRQTESGKPKDPACDSKETAEHLLVENGGVKDVVVRLAVGAAPKPAEVPAPAVIDQKNCRYTPHVLGIVAGQKIAYRNSDATMHNVHTYAGAETDFNIAQPKGAADNAMPVSTPPGDAPYRVRCDVHPWMSAYVLVTDHPYFTVTSSDGSFKLANVPLGSYTLEAWHPHMGKKTAQVKVEPGKPVTATFAAFTPADYKQPE